MGFDLNKCYSHPGKLLKVHLEKVVSLSKRFTSSHAAELVSLFHDIGKVNPNFQEKLNGSCPKEYDHHAYLRISLRWYRCSGRMVPRGAEPWYRSYRSDGTGTKCPLYTLSKGALQIVLQGTLS